MSLSAKLSSDKHELIVSVPPTRSDILHACDVMEDAAIAYNFNKIAKTVPKISTVAVQLPINKLSDQMRREIAMAGYTEVLAFTLCSHAENFGDLNHADDGSAVTLSNPKTVEYQVVRTTLVPGLLKTLAANKHSPLPLKLFEVSDIVLRDESQDRRARNQRNIAALFCGKSSGFEIVHGLVDRIFLLLGVSNYGIVESADPLFFPGRRADVLVGGVKVGHFGIVHPEVLGKFDVAYPTSLVELNLEPFL
jgi:phenylalanyl-tRNA synthetase beta chain